MLDHEWLPPFRAALSWAYAELGRPDDARSILDGFMSGGLAGIPRDRSWLFTLCFLGRACVRLGDLGAASELYHLLLPCRREMAQGILVWIGPVAHDLGLLAAALGRYDDAEQHFAAAAESQERIGALVTLAQTRLEWSRMLLTRRGPRDKERASELVRQALSAARELSLANVERRAVALFSQVS
jgi:tetratricopeptide (TPR) repeat protein